MIWSSEVLSSITGGKTFSKWHGNKIVFDSRLVEHNDIFIALPGANLDGHDFVKQALEEKGAAAAIVSRIPEGLEDISKLLIVEDVSSALSIMAKYKRNKSKAKIIAITGSVGKTSTKELMGLALSIYGKTYVSRGNYNNFLGVPINLASMPDDCEYAVIEIGMDHAGEITPLSQLVKPNIAVITAIESIHLANFNSIEGIARAKAEIFSGLTPNSTVVISSLSNCYEILLEEANANPNIKKIINIGEDSNIASYQIINNETYATLRINLEKVALRLDSIIGKHQIHNMMVVLTCLKELSLDINKAADSLSNFKLPRGRGAVFNIEVSGKKITLIDDSYNAGPVSIKAALKNLSSYQGRKIAILGDMTEQGKESLKVHLDLKNDIINNKIDKIICFGQQMGELFKTLPKEIQLGAYKDLKTLAKDLPDLIQENDVLLIKGSFYLTRLFHFTQHLIEGTLDAV